MLLAITTSLHIKRRQCSDQLTDLMEPFKIAKSNFSYYCFWEVQKGAQHPRFSTPGPLKWKKMIWWHFQFFLLAMKVNDKANFIKLWRHGARSFYWSDMEWPYLLCSWDHFHFREIAYYDLASVDNWLSVCMYVCMYVCTYVCMYGLQQIRMSRSHTPQHLSVIQTHDLTRQTCQRYRAYLKQTLYILYCGIENQKLRLQQIWDIRLHGEIVY